MTDEQLGIKILKWLEENRESVPGKGRSAREQLLDVVFFDNTEGDAVKEIAEEVALLCEQVLRNEVDASGMDN